jgi:polar amino acid transport system substrate-binding protein
LGILLEYPERKEAGNRTVVVSSHAKKSTIGIGFVGLGSFAESMLMPPLKAGKVDFIGVSTGTPVNAKSAAQKYGFRVCSTDSMEIINNPDVTAIFCASRHDSHARYVEAAITAGKPIFVEKPLCINRKQLSGIDKAIQLNNGRVMVGFNRRFSESFRAIKKFYNDRSEPMAITYRVNAGFIPKTSWIQDPAQGGRIIGEGCHFIDTMAYLTGSVPVRVYAEALSSPNREIIHHDNVVITVKFADGSVGVLEYFANGDPAVAKEFCQVFCENKVAVMNNFKTVELTVGKKTKTLSFDGSKGQREEVAATLDSIKNGKSMPISYEQIRGVTLATFAAEESLSTGSAVVIE